MKPLYKNPLLKRCFVCDVCLCVYVYVCVMCVVRVCVCMCDVCVCVCTWLVGDVCMYVPACNIYSYDKMQ